MFPTSGIGLGLFGLGSVGVATWQNAEWSSSQFFYLLGLVALILGFALVRRREGVLVSIARSACLLLCILALAGPFKKESEETREIAALLDVSKSVSPTAQKEFLRELLKIVRVDESTELSVAPFAEGVSDERLAVKAGDTADSLLRRIAEVSSSLNPNGSVMATALKHVVEGSGSASVFLMSDAMETSGNALEFVKRGGMQGVHIYPLAPNPALFSQPKFEISTIYAPLTVNAEEKAEVRATVGNTTNSEQMGRLELYADNKKILSQNISVKPGEERLVTSPTPALEGGVHRLRATLSRDGNVEQGTVELYRWISVKNKEKILLLSGNDDDERVLAKLLMLKGFAVESIVGDGSKQIPTALQDYSSVIFNNIAARQLPSSLLPTLKGFVQGGGGVILLGGVRSFGLGGYIDTPLEEISPLKFVPPQTKKRRLNSGIVLLVDKSRSMLSDGKIEAAKRSAYAAINALKDDDYVAVIGFDTGPFTIISMTAVPEAKNVADRRLRNLTAAGQTNVLPALELARKSLVDAPVSRKHIILLTDGKFPAYEGDYQNVVAQLRTDGITLSAVAMGVEADAPLLKMMASVGKGAFYQTLDPSQLPEIFVQDIKVTTGEETMKENAEFPVLVGPGGVVSTSFTRFPPLEGFLETLPKKGSTLELITKKEEEAYPVMASWTIGDGRVIAYASDANGRWSYPWLKWENFHRFWYELVNQVKRKSGDTQSQVDFDLRYSVVGKSIIFDLAVYDDKLQSEAPPTVKAKVEEPSKEIKQVAFSPIRKGRFNGVLERGRAGDYRLEISYGNISFPALAITVPEDAFGEVAGRGVNMQLLAELANFSGGVVNPSESDLVFKRNAQDQVKYLAAPLILLVILLVIVEAILRELGWLRLIRALFPGRKAERKSGGIYANRKYRIKRAA